MTRDITTAPVPGNEITLVTAFFELDNSGRGRSVRDYHAWIANFLPFVRWPLVIYCDEQSVEMLKHLRGDKPAVYRVMRLDEFSVYRERDLIREHAARSPERNPDVALVNNEKFSFVRRAIERNVFRSEMFFWCDIGFFRKGEQSLYFFERIEWPNLRACRAALARTGVALFGSPPPPSTATPWPQGGWWGGLTQPLHHFCVAVERCRAERARRGAFINNEEACLREAVTAEGIDAHVFTGDDIRWLRRLALFAPPPQIS